LALHTVGRIFTLLIQESRNQKKSTCLWMLCLTVSRPWSPGLVGKYTTKALNGFWHSFAFTTGRFHEPIQINARNRAVTEAACRHCHGAVVEAMDAGRPGAARLACTGCHASVGHLQ
jgi:hypothetical protein